MVKMVKNLCDNQARLRVFGRISRKEYTSLLYCQRNRKKLNIVERTIDMIKKLKTTPIALSGFPNC